LRGRITVVNSLLILTVGRVLYSLAVSRNMRWSHVLDNYEEAWKKALFLKGRRELLSLFAYYTSIWESQ
jgi:hypothetical protein